MGQAKTGLKLVLGALCVVWAGGGFVPEAKAQFFWFFDQQKKAALDVLVDTRRRLYGILADGRDGER